jgi:hypothetical protein
MQTLKDAVAIEVREQPGVVKHEDDFYRLRCCLQTPSKSKKTEADQSLDEFIKKIRVFSEESRHATPQQ